MADIVGMKTIRNINLNRKMRGGYYADLIDVCELLAWEKYGGGPNALYAVSQESPLFQATIEKIRARRASTEPSEAA